MIINAGLNHLFPHTGISSFTDLSIVPKATYGGAIMAAGYLPYGNPLAPLTLTVNNTQNFREKSLNAVDGGNQKHQSIYAMKQFFAKYSGVIAYTRLLGVDSTTKVIKLIDTAGTLSVDQATTVKVYGAIDSIASFADTIGTGILEMVVTGCPDTDMIVSITNKGDIMRIIVQNSIGETYFDIKGSTDMDGKDDNGNDNYIGKMIDDNVAIIKVNKDNAGYQSTFDTIVATITTPTVDTGLLNYVDIAKQFRLSAQIASYTATFGSTDVSLINAMTASMRDDGGHKCVVVDLMGSTYAQAKAFKESLAFVSTTPEEKAKVWCFWNPVSGSYNGTRQVVCVSGWYVGGLLARNNRTVKNGVEDRISYQVAGVDFPLPIPSPMTSFNPEYDERDTATADRINFVEVNSNGDATITDILTSNPKETYAKGIGVVDRLTHVEQLVARILDSFKFKNMTIVEKDALSLMDKLGETLDSLGYLYKGTSFEYQLDLLNNEGFLAKIAYYPSGDIRINRVEATILRLKG